jgi:hypothetical protein
MIKTILVPATSNETDTATFAAALRSAHVFSDHIDSLHAHIDSVEVAVKSAPGFN